MKRTGLFLLFLVFLLASCASSSGSPTRTLSTEVAGLQPSTVTTTVEAARPRSTATLSPTSPPTSTLTPTATNTARPTDTPALTDTPAPIDTPTPRPSPTSTPIPWQTYHIIQTIRAGELSKLWLPAPRDWDGVGMRNVQIIDISPEPKDLFETGAGNLIAFWEHENQKQRDYLIDFTVELAPIAYSIDPNTIGEYDTASEEYIRYTQPTEYLQCDAPAMVEKAREIVGSETNPYHQARLVHAWMENDAEFTDAELNPDALSALEHGINHCGHYSHLFVALLRSLGIPARAVYGLHGSDSLTLYTGERYRGETEPGDFENHIWAEFLLPGYGWIQNDGGDPYVFARIDQHRLVLGRGEDVDLGHGFPNDPLPWFHHPIANFTALEPPGENEFWGDVWRLDVTAQ